MITFDVIFIVIFVEIAVIFIYNETKNKGKFDFNLGWAVFFACFSIVQISLFYQRYFLPEEIWTEYEQPLRLIGMIPMVLALAVMEYIFKEYKNTHYILTILSTILGLFVIFIGGFITELITIIFFALLLAFGILFFKKLASLTSGAMKRNIIYFEILIIILLTIDNFEADFAIQNAYEAGVNVFLYLIIIQLIQITSIVCLALVLFKIPIFLELDWKENLDEMYIVHKINSVPIFSTKFQEIPVSADQKEPEGVDRDLVAGGMVGISAMLKEISKSSEDLNIIDHGDQFIILEHSQHIFIALIVKKQMRIYSEKMEELSNIIEKYYGHILENWDGGLDYFKPLDGIVENIFK
jgi:hypothetical protein